MGLTVATADVRAGFLTGGAVTWQQPQGPDANATTGAQTIAVLCDNEGSPLLRVVRGINGTTNLVVKDQLGADSFITVQSGTTLAASASVVA